MSPHTCEKIVTYRSDVKVTRSQDDLSFLVTDWGLFLNSLWASVFEIRSEKSVISPCPPAKRVECEVLVDADGLSSGGKEGQGG